jgi:hypothetical protein
VEEKAETRNIPRSTYPFPRLRIAQVAPLLESVPPRGYGGTERVVAYLCQELQRRGHDVTLFASGDSTVDVHLKPGRATSLGISGLDTFGAAYHLPMLNAVTEHAEDFDIIHFTSTTGIFHSSG